MDASDVTLSLVGRGYEQLSACVAQTEETQGKNLGELIKKIDMSSI